MTAEVSQACRAKLRLQRAGRPASAVVLRVAAMLVPAFLFAIAASSSAAEAKDCRPRGGFGFICGLNEPEDIVPVEGTPWVLVSDMAGHRAPGDVYLIDRRSRAVRPLRLAAGAEARPEPGFQCPGPPDPARFTSHGLGVGAPERGGRRLYVVNHGEREAVEVFRIIPGTGEPRFTWIGCVVMPEGADANSVAPLRGGAFLVTSLFSIEDRTFAEKLQRVGRAEPSGAVWEWRPGHDLRRLKLPPLSGTNGLVASADGHTLFVNAWAERAIYRFDLAGRAPPRRLKVNFLPDNLHRTAAGLLLAAGQDADVVANYHCMTGANPPTYCAGRWGAALVDPATMKIVRHWTGDGKGAFGDVTAAFDAGRELWLASLHGDRLATLPK